MSGGEGSPRPSIPARLDALAWSARHSRIVAVLGFTWILDGLQVAVVGGLGSVFRDRTTLGLTAVQVGVQASWYLAGTVAGALIFGTLADRYGRKRLYVLTMAIYLAGTFLTALSWGFWSFSFFRFLAGLGIGGESTAINSAIDEFIPARFRGRVALGINGSFWFGVAGGSFLTETVLTRGSVSLDRGWRFAFVLSATIGLFILYFRGFVPESPRWLEVRGRRAEAEEVVRGFEARSVASGVFPKAPEETFAPPVPRPPRSLLGLVFGTYRRQALLGFSLMFSQAFFFNAFFFTFSLILSDFYGVNAVHAGIYLLPFALMSMAGPLVLGSLFDLWGRRVMIAGTYAGSGLLLIGGGLLFCQGRLTLLAQVLIWSATGFFASTAASSAYLTVGEVFPVEVRAKAVAVFFAAGTGLGGTLAPPAMGALIASGHRCTVLEGYIAAGAMMIAAALVEAKIGIDAERKPLEEIGGGGGP